MDPSLLYALPPPNNRKQNGAYCDLTRERGQESAEHYRSPVCMACAEGPSQVGRLKVGPKCLILCGERAGARTQDPVIKSHVLYRLSYALPWPPMA